MHDSSVCPIVNASCRAIRGLAAPIRYILHYKNISFEDRTYAVTQTDSGFDTSSWSSVKQELGLDFPNLPYYIDGSLKISQSDTIIRHLGRCHSLYGKSLEDQAHVDMLIDFGKDMSAGVTRMAYNKPQFDSLKADLVSKSAPAWLASLSKYLGTNDWLVGNSLTVADFVIYERLAVLHKLEASIFDAHSNLQQYLQRFEALPGVKEYLASADYKAQKCNNKMAAWEG